MDITVECPCGQHFEFEVEPVDGLMPSEVQCPTCGADGTAQANKLIGEQLAAPPAAAPVPPPPTPAPTGLRINRAHDSTPLASAAAPAAPAFIVPPAKTSARKSGDSDGSGFHKGVIGALAASIVGMVAWYFLIKLTGYQIGYAAWAVGGLTGIGARVLGAEGSTKLGIVAGVCAFVAIIGGQYLVAKSYTDTEFDKIALESYQEQLDSANAAVALTTADDTKSFIAKLDEVKVAEVTADRMKEFREQDLPKFRDLIAGKPSKAEIMGRLTKVKNSFAVQFEVLKESVGIFTLLWLFLGVGSAFKLGAGTNEE